MKWTNVLTIYGKELRDMLRDRRTLLSMIVIPMVLMPSGSFPTRSCGRRGPPHRS
jgi:sodium transport system permease protein